MHPEHQDALLGGTWSCDLDDDDLYPPEAVDEMQTLLDELIETIEG